MSPGRRRPKKHPNRKRMVSSNALRYAVERGTRRPAVPRGMGGRVRSTECRPLWDAARLKARSGHSRVRRGAQRGRAPKFGARPLACSFSDLQSGGCGI